MKTAVSIPDEVFEEAERLARRMKRSRSEVFEQQTFWIMKVASGPDGPITRAMGRHWTPVHLDNLSDAAGNGVDLVRRHA